MADISGAELTLRTTPTAGVSGEHSPYYRRLLSSGYKGYLQGSLGGATFYGVIGLAIGAAIAVPLMLGVATPVHPHARRCGHFLGRDRAYRRRHRASSAPPGR
ncbi:MAG: hypothetical protein WDN72_06060 [Alphaproteobacteria bacterium]